MMLRTRCPIGIAESEFGVGPAVDVWRWPIQASSPERAILEALDELPRQVQGSEVAVAT